LGEFEVRFSKLDVGDLMAIRPYTVPPPELDLAPYLEWPTSQELGGRSQSPDEPLATDTGTPVFKYQYPPDFPQSARLAIEAERIQADREFGEGAEFLRLDRHFKGLRLAWFKRVFVTGCRVIRELGISGLWGRNRTESTEAEFFKATAIAAGIAVATTPEATINPEATEMQPPPDTEAPVMNAEVSPEPPTPLGTAPYPKRAAWFENELSLREWSVHELQGQGGPDWKTSRKILDGLHVSRAVLERTAAALSKKKKRVLFRDIPRE
jgi:hypothetical protein